MSLVHRAISIITLVSAAVLAGSPARGELKLPRVSQKASLVQTLGYTEITVIYSRPGVKGRTIWGQLVPLDTPWRTGANEATLFTCSDDITVEGKKLPAGTYSFFTIPSERQWTIVFNKEKDLWGAFEYKPAMDALRVTVTPQPAPHEEWMSFGFANLTPSSGQLQLRWEKLQIPITIGVDAVNQAIAHARAEIAAAKPGDWSTLYRAADYCFASSANLEEARRWAERSAKIEENYYNVSLLAKMRAQAGNTKEAIALGQKAVKLGKASKETIDTRPTELLLAQWTAKAD